MAASQRPAFAGRKLIDAYGDNGFRFDGLRVSGSVLLLPGGMYPWEAAHLEDVDRHSLDPVFEASDQIDIFVLGCGAQPAPLKSPLLDALKRENIGIEALATGAACRMYNVLVNEKRRVAAGLIAVP